IPPALNTTCVGAPLGVDLPLAYFTSIVNVLLPDACVAFAYEPTGDVNVPLPLTLALGSYQITVVQADPMFPAASRPSTHRFQIAAAGEATLNDSASEVSSYAPSTGALIANAWAPLTEYR